MTAFRTYDIWATERENADALPMGLRVRRHEGPRPGAAIWMPKATKPAGNYSFRSVEAREAYIEQFVSHYAEVQAMKDERKAKKQAAIKEHINEIGVGHIFHYSWGYEQTNVNYYQVTEKRGQTITLREIACSTVPGSGYRHGMADMVEPRIGHFLENSKPFTKRLQFTTEGEAYVTMSSYGWCSLWRGGATYRSWYA